MSDNSKKSRGSHVICEVDPIILQGSNGYDTPSVQATCTKCGHSTESWGEHMGSIKRCMAMMNEECPLGQNNFYSMAEDSEMSQSIEEQEQKVEDQDRFTGKMSEISQGLDDLDDCLEDDVAPWEDAPSTESPFQERNMEELQEGCGFCQKQFLEIELLQWYPKSYLCKSCIPLILKRLEKFIGETDE